MNYADFPPYYSEPSASSETEPTVQIPVQPPIYPTVRITPGGARRDWRLTRHLLAGIGILLIVIALLVRLPVTPSKVAAKPAAPIERLPLPPPVTPTQQAAPPSYYAPQTPAMFQAPQNGAPYPAAPPSGAAWVEVPVASRLDTGAGLPAAFGRVGFVVPPAVPLPPDSIAFRLHR